MQEMQVQSLGWQDPLEKGIAYPLQYSNLDNLMDRGAWQTTVHGVTKSQTRLSVHAHTCARTHTHTTQRQIWSTALSRSNYPTRLRQGPCI